MSKNTMTLDDPPSILNPTGASPNFPLAAPAPPAPALALKNLGSNTTTDPNDPLYALQVEELMLRVQEMKERRKVIEEKENQMKSMRLQNAQLVKRKILEDEREQEVCSHRMENGDPYTVGSRDHRQNIIIMCQSCRKLWHRGPHWTSNPEFDPKGDVRKPLPAGIKFSPRLPKEIYPKGDAIGGPAHV